MSPPLRLMENLTSVQSNTNMNSCTDLSTLWSEIIPLWSYIIAVLQQLMWPSLLLSAFTLVSPVICRGGERERERGALWFGCPSHQVLCPCGRHFSVFLHWHIFSALACPGVFAVQQAQFCRGSKMQAYFHSMQSASVNSFCRSSHITTACCSLGCCHVVRLVLNLFPCLCIVSVHACLGAPISIRDSAASHFTPIQKF